MKLNYQIEIDSFKQNFHFLFKKKIVLYGIGRRTATLVPALEEWDIVGLMDKNPDNIGKRMFGLPIISLEEAEKKADAIIINAPPAYWKIIFTRISAAKIAIYYLDGTKAVEEVEDYGANEYWNKTLDELVLKIGENEAISFDLFDTLIMRKVYSPQDIWELMETVLRKENIEINNFVEYRKLSIANTQVREPNIYDIYKTFQKLVGLDEKTLKKICEIELQVEKENIVVRKDMCRVLQYANEIGRNVYIVSDMYLPIEFIKELLKENQINVKEENIFLSNQKKATKRSGELWKIFLKEIPTEKILHIGDDFEGDIKKATENGITAYQVKAAADLLGESAMHSLTPELHTLYASGIVGLFGANVLNSPYALHLYKGKICLDQPEQIGYTLFGPVIYTFLRWIKEYMKEERMEKVYFLARDGFFLAEDFDYLQDLQHDIKVESEYLETSRRAAMIANVVDEKTLDDVIQFPYNGRFDEFLMDRFSILADKRSIEWNDRFISTVKDYEKVRELIHLYRMEIFEESCRERENYLCYLNGKNITDKTCIVDLFFYGNTQYYLSKLLDKSLVGLYMACDISEQNRCVKNNMLVPCFQTGEDVHAKNSMILKNCLLLESFLTAPHGMLLKVDEKQNFIYEKSGKNQQNFKFREQINLGVKSYIKDAENLLKEVPLDTLFIDKYYGILMEHGIVFTEKIKEYFYFDNSLVQRREMKIIE